MTSPRLNAAALRLMAVTDNSDAGAGELVQRVRAAVEGGATIVQVRLKQESARAVVSITREIVSAVPVPVIVNDRFDVALAAGAHGVHLGADDLPVELVREVVPVGFIIGTSVGCLDEIPNAAHADYVGIGPVYPTGSKGDAGKALGVSGLIALRDALHASALAIPVVAIGGINAGNAAYVFRAGVEGLAVISGLFGQPDPARAARELIRASGS